MATSDFPLTMVVPVTPRETAVSPALAAPYGVAPARLTPYHRATAERDEARERTRAVLAHLEDLRRLWSLPKYHAPQADGSRGDWIASGDVLRELEALKATAAGEPYPR